MISFAAAILTVGLSIQDVPVTQIDSRARCADCLRIEEPIVLGKPTDDVALSRMSVFAADPSSPIFYAYRTYFAGRVVRYDGSGAQGPMFGRMGEGPGEFQGVGLTVSMKTDPVGNIHVYQGIRGTAIDAGFEALIRTIRIPPDFNDAMPLANGTTVVTRRIVNRDGGESHLEAIDSLSNSRTLESDLAEGDAWYVDASRSGGFWLTSRDTYLLREYSAAGERLREIRRDVDWFEPYYPDAPSALPFVEPVFLDMYEDGNGLIWTLVRIADEDLDDWLEETESFRFDTLDWSTVVDTMIEVLDPRSGEVIASQRFDEAYQILPGPYLVRFQESPSGLIQVVISELSIN